MLLLRALLKSRVFFVPNIFFFSENIVASFLLFLRALPPSSPVTVVTTGHRWRTRRGVYFPWSGSVIEESVRLPSSVFLCGCRCSRLVFVYLCNFRHWSLFDCSG